MAKKKGKRGIQKAKYLPGITWQDALAGRPVTKEDVISKVAARARLRKVTGLAAKCRNCSKQDSLPRSAFFKAAKPKCLVCGGWMDPIAPLHHKETIKKGTKKAF